MWIDVTQTSLISRYVDTNIPGRLFCNLPGHPLIHGSSSLAKGFISHLYQKEERSQRQPSPKDTIEVNQPHAYQTLPMQSSTGARVSLARSLSQETASHQFNIYLKRIDCGAAITS